MRALASVSSEPSDAHYLKSELLTLLRTREDVAAFLILACLDGVWYWDLENPDHEWMSANFWTTLGYDPAAMPHRAAAWQNIIHPDDLQTAQKNFERHSADPDHPYDQIVRYRHADGSTVWIRCRGMAIRNDQGAPIRMLGAHADITAQKNKEIELARRNDELEALSRALRMRERELETIINNVPARIWYKDEHNRILRANEAAAQSMDCRLSDLIGANTAELFPEMAEKYHADDLRVIESGAAERGIIESYAPKGGIQGWTSTDKIPVQLDDGARGILVVSSDVTALKTREEQLKFHNQNLKDFASVVAHDLKAPLRQALMFLNMLEKDMASAGPAAPAIHKSVDGMSLVLDRMMRIVNSLYELFKLGALDLTPTPTPLRAAVDHAVAQTGHHLRERDAAVVIDDLPTLPVDADLIAQVFQNLIANACKYSRAPALNIHIHSERDIARRRYYVYVDDNGEGIPEHAVESVFEPYKRLHDGDDIEGSGIGLALCRRIISLHRGSIYVDPTYTDGTRFVVSFSI